MCWQPYLSSNGFCNRTLFLLFLSFSRNSFCSEIRWSDAREYNAIMIAIGAHQAMMRCQCCSRHQTFPIQMMEQFSSINNCRRNCRLSIKSKSSIRTLIHITQRPHSHSSSSSINEIENDFNHHTRQTVATLQMHNSHLCACEQHLIWIWKIVLWFHCITTRHETLDAAAQLISFRVFFFFF